MKSYYNMFFIDCYSLWTLFGLIIVLIKFSILIYHPNHIHSKWNGIWLQPLWDDIPTYSLLLLTWYTCWRHFLNWLTNTPFLKVHHEHSTPKRIQKLSQDEYLWGVDRPPESSRHLSLLNAPGSGFKPYKVQGLCQDFTMCDVEVVLVATFQIRKLLLESLLQVPILLLKK